MIYLFIFSCVLIFCRILITNIQQENKQNKFTNRIQQLRTYIAPKLENIDNIQLIVNSQTNNYINFISLQEIIFKSHDTFEILELQLIDRKKFRIAIKQLIIFYLKKMLSNQNISYPDNYKDYDEFNQQYLEIQQNSDTNHSHFKSQQKFVLSVILQYIIYLQDEYFLSDLIKDDFLIYQSLRGNAIREVEQNLELINGIFNQDDIGSPNLNQFQNTRYDKLSSIEDQKTDQDIELCTSQFNMIYDSTKVGEDSMNPSNTNRFFNLLENKLQKVKGYSQIIKDVVIGPDKLLSNVLEKINRSKNKEGNEPYFQNLIKDFKRFTLNFHDEGNIKDQIEHLTNPSLFGPNLADELNLESKVTNVQGGFDIFNQKVHIKSLKNMFASSESENVYKDLKIIFEVMIVESGLVFQVELQCNLKSFADWKATDHIFQDIHRKEDEFNLLHGEFKEFLWYESRKRKILIAILNLIWILAIILIFITTISLDDYYEMNYEKLEIKQLRILGQKHRMLGNNSKSLKQQNTIVHNANHNDEDLQIQSLVFVENSQYDEALKNLHNILLRNEHNKKQLLKIAEVFLKQKNNYEKSIEQYKKLTKIDNNNQDAYEGLGISQSHKLQYQNAIKAFNRAIEINPQGTVSQIEIGIMYQRKNDQANAITSLEKSIHLNPNIIKSQIQLGKSYQKINEQDMVIQSYKNAARLDSNNIDANNGMGYVLLMKNDPDNALYQFIKANLIDPENVYSLIGIGITHFKKNDQQKANKSFDNAIDIDIESLIQIGKAFQKIKEFNQAIEQLQRVIEKNPKSIKAQVLLGKTYQKMKLQDHAIDSYLKAIELDPKIEQAYIGIGYAQLMKIDQRMAIVYFKKEIEINPQNDDCQNENGIIYQTINEQESAINSFNKAIKINYRSLRSQIQLAKSYQKIREYKNSIKTFERAIKIQPNNIQSQIGIGIVQFKQHENDKAFKAFETAIEKSTYQSDNQINNGYKNQNNNNFTEAIKSFEKCLKNNPKNVEANIGIGLSQIKLNEEEEAIDQFQQGIEILNNNIDYQIRIDNLNQVKIEKQTVQISQNLIV